ncbi:MULTISPECIES: hypothetical protein [unclassified Frankia]|uniref:hypothetical protein n=1 Tax=unclassified Frankia TaxID=2632575 RepID=UPI001EF746BA|nr:MULTISPECIES: hypothetical protein [unclassified Frankia]
MSAEPAAGDRPESVTREVNMLCPTCEGLGCVTLLQVARLSGEPCQLRSTTACPDCVTTGYRPLTPPI